MIEVSANLTLPDTALEWRTGRSGGPGGQHVNTTDSAVQLRFDAAGCGLLSAGQLKRLRAASGSRMTQDGVVLIDATGARSQHQNRADAAARLAALVRSVLTPPKARIATKPSRAAKRRRVEAKQKRGALKTARRKPSLDG